MALVLTERDEEVSAGFAFGTGAFTSAAFTPTANSLLVAYITGLTNQGEMTGMTVTTSTGIVMRPAGPMYQCSEATVTGVCFSQWWIGDVGGSPVSTTLSVQGNKTNLVTLDMINWGVWIADYTGHNTTNPIGAWGGLSSRTDPNALTYNLSGSPASNSVVLAGYAGYFTGASNTNVVNAGSGWTEVWEIDDANFNMQVQHFSSGPDQSVEWADVTSGTGTFSTYSSAAIEIVAAGQNPNVIAAKPVDYKITVTTGNASWSPTMPSGIVAGELLLAWVASDTNTLTANSGWTEIDNLSNTTAIRGYFYAKIAAGSDTLTLTNAGGQDMAALVMRVKDHGVSNVATDITKGTAATGNSTAPNPPNVNPGVSKAWLFLMGFWIDDDNNSSNWTASTTGVFAESPLWLAESASSTTSCMIGVAYQQSVATSYDAAAMTVSAATVWIAQSYAIPPVTFGGVVVPDPYKYPRTRNLVGGRFR